MPPGKRSALWGFVALASSLPQAWPLASPVPVRHREGSTHGFVVLRSVEGKLLAEGDSTQIVEGDRIISSLILHFRDGSLHEETTEFSQKSVFRVISDHIRQEGPSFAEPVDTHIDATTGHIKVRGKDGKEEETQLKLPEDLANGLLITILKNLPTSAAHTTVSMLTTTSKPRIVKLEIRREGTEAFSAGGSRRKATHLIGHIDVGGVAGVVAKATGKLPPDVDFWILEGKAPAFIRFKGPLATGGPVWIIELTAPKLITGSSSGEPQH
jgi:hypothetical protein